MWDAKQKLEAVVRAGRAPLAGAAVGLLVGILLLVILRCSQGERGSAASHQAGPVLTLTAQAQPSAAAASTAATQPASAAASQPASGAGSRQAATAPAQPPHPDTLLAYFPLPPSAAGPQVWPSPTLAPAPIRSHMPPIAPPTSARLLGVEKDHSVRARGMADLPPLLADAGPAVPAAPRLRAELPASAASLDERTLLFVLGNTPPDTARSSPTSDGVEVLARQVVLTRITGQRQSPEPFLRLGIPDPFEAAAAVALRRPPADAEPPATVPIVPARVTLPVNPVTPAPG